MASTGFVGIDTASVLRKLMRNLYVTSEGCYEWTGATARDGYGYMAIDGTTRRVHRVAAVIFFGFDIRSDLHVLHHCDNPRCWNPDHLWLGTVRDNMQDRNLKGRARGPRGTLNASAKLTEADVLEIRRRYGAGERQFLIADDLGLRRSLVNDVVHRKTWKHV